MRNSLNELRRGVRQYSTIRLVASSIVLGAVLVMTVANVVDKAMWLKIVFFD